MINAFTGETMKTAKSELDLARQDGLKLKALHDSETIETGTGPRPRSRGQVYDIPPDNGTYKPDQVDQLGADEVDINAVMKRYEKTGQLTELIKLGMGTERGFYGDFVDAPDYQEALNITMHAQEQFALLEANIRNRFDNDPAKFLAFVADGKNREEAKKLGLLKPEVASSTPSSAPAGGQPTPPASPARGTT